MIFLLRHALFAFVFGADVTGAAAVEVDGLAQAAERTPPTECTYRTYQWSTVERRSVNHRTVSHSYADVTAEERSEQDPRCTVCSEDQVEVDLAAVGIEGIDPFRVCWAYADSVREAFRAIAMSGSFDVVEVTGYRPGQTRGRIVDGMRTGWSNHSFGTALDINADQNGLYGDCDVSEVTADSIDECDLRVGGAWDPERRPRQTIVRGDVVYRAFVDGVGWGWGGEITGGTRDMMHFSPDGR